MWRTFSAGRVIGLPADAIIIACSAYLCNTLFIGHRQKQANQQDAIRGGPDGAWI